MASKIEWTEETWNPTVGCDKISEGCKNCYAITMANRLAHIPNMTALYMDTVTTTAAGKHNWTGVVKVAESNFDKPFRFKKPTTFFVDSMSDLFHKDVPMHVIADVFAIMYLNKHHKFQVLTKRAERLLILNTDEFKEAYHKACNAMHDKYIGNLEQEMYQYRG